MQWHSCIASQNQKAHINWIIEIRFNRLALRKSCYPRIGVCPNPHYQRSTLRWRLFFLSFLIWLLPGTQHAKCSLSLLPPKLRILSHFCLPALPMCALRLQSSSQLPCLDGGSRGRSRSWVSPGSARCASLRLSSDWLRGLCRSETIAGGLAAPLRLTPQWGSSALEVAQLDVRSAPRPLHARLSVFSSIPLRPASPTFTLRYASFRSPSIRLGPRVTRRRQSSAPSAALGAAPAGRDDRHESVVDEPSFGYPPQGPERRPLSCRSRRQRADELDGWSIRASRKCSIRYSNILLFKLNLDLGPSVGAGVRVAIVPDQLSPKSKEDCIFLSKERHFGDFFKVMRQKVRRIIVEFTQKLILVFSRKSVFFDWKNFPISPFLPENYIRFFPLFCERRIAFSQSICNEIPRVPQTITFAFLFKSWAHRPVAWCMH